MFIEEQLLTPISYGFTGGPTWATTRVELVSGIVRRNAERSRPVYVYKAPFDSIAGTDYANLLDAFNACMGPVVSFRFKDALDYQAYDEYQGMTVLGTNQMQLIKNYEWGAFNTVRPLRKPVESTLTLYVAGVTEPLWTLDSTTGEITFEALAPDLEVRASLEFDVPVFFDTDQMQATLENWSAHSSDLTLREDFDQ